MTRPSKPTPPVQLEPASACPAKVTTCPWHGPPPSTSPVARNGSANGAGHWVRPWPVKEMVPVGLAGVPPQGHLVAACADVTPPARASALAPAPSAARNLNETAAWLESLRLFTFPAPFSWRCRTGRECKHPLAQVSTCSFPGPNPAGRQASKQAETCASASLHSCYP